MTKNYSPELLKYVKYNSGLLSNKFIAKKFNITIKELYTIQKNLGVGSRKSLLGFDLLTGIETKKQLGISKSFELNKISESGLIKIQKIGTGKGKGHTCISLEDLEKLEQFFKEWIPLIQVSKILKWNRETTRIYLKKHIENNEIKIKKLKNKILYNKKDVIELKQKLIEITKDCYTVKEFASLINYDLSLIYKKIKKGEIVIKNNNSPILIPSSELKKFKN